MKIDKDASNKDNLLRASYALLFVSLLVTAAATVFDLRTALLPLAVVFGWSQIGGL